MRNKEPDRRWKNDLERASEITSRRQSERDNEQETERVR